MEDTLWASLTDAYVKLPMALTAEKLAEQYSISREDCDQYALQSQQRWAAGKVVYLSIMIAAWCLCLTCAVCNIILSCSWYLWVATFFFSLFAT